MGVESKHWSEVNLNGVPPGATPAKGSFAGGKSDGKGSKEQLLLKHLRTPFRDFPIKTFTFLTAMPGGGVTRLLG